MLTIRQILDRTAKFLKEREVPTPRVDAEVMLSDLLGMKRIELYMHADRPLDEAETTAFRAMVERRAAREPVAYILGETAFWTLDLAVDNRVLIPRPETEHIVDLVLAFTSEERDREWKVVDVGTGSGALALAIASELPNAAVLAVDIDADALTLARENAERNNLRERVKFVQGDLLSPLIRGRHGALQVDIVVSNPPYVAVSDELGFGVGEFEPSHALLSGDDGLHAIRRLMPQAEKVLPAEGAFFCEFGWKQGEAVLELAREHFSEVEVVKDYSGHDRVLAATNPLRHNR